MPAAPLPDAVALARLDARFPARRVELGQGASVSLREAGQGPAILCLHGIGSGAASWQAVAAELSPQARLIAWDAPGYGESTPLAPAVPSAADYAQRLARLVDALELDDVLLVAHSLGALMAGAAVRAGGPLARRVRRLVLLSPAAGYGAPGREAARARVHAERLASLDALGIEGMAMQRAERLVSDAADDTARQWVRWNMARLHDGGYRQAIELLCGGDLLADLPPAVPLTVGVGSRDVVTTPEACAAVAERGGVPLRTIDGAGHAVYVEQPAAVAALLREALAA